MSSYTADQYADQRRITKQIGEANHTGWCVVCHRRPLAYWPTGQRRITCGADECYHKWLRVRTEKRTTDEQQSDGPAGNAGYLG